MQISILEMLEMQSNLNDFTNGSEWRTGVTNKGKKINWNTAIVLECAELIDSTPWKHWKNIEGVSDIDNIKIEIVDIFHFLASLSLVNNSPDAISFIIESQFLEFLENKSFNYEDLILSTKKLMSLSLNTELRNIEYDITEGAKLLASMMSNANMTFEELYSIYVSKNVLNIFRQNNGYKEGEYIKIWNGVEDNVILTELKNSLDIITFDELYSGLEKRYKNVK